MHLLLQCLAVKFTAEDFELLPAVLQSTQACGLPAALWIAANPVLPCGRHELLRRCDTWLSWLPAAGAKEVQHRALPERRRSACFNHHARGLQVLQHLGILSCLCCLASADTHSTSSGPRQRLRAPRVPPCSAFCKESWESPSHGR